MGEVAVAALSRGLHETPRPALADADADVMRLFRQTLEEHVVPPLTQRRDTGADVDKVRIAGRFQEGARRRERLTQVEGADQVRFFQECDRGFHVFRASHHRLGRELPYSRGCRENDKRVVVLGVLQQRADDVHLHACQQRIAVAG